LAKSGNRCTVDLRGCGHDASFINLNCSGLPERQVIEEYLRDQDHLGANPLAVLKDFSAL